MLVLLVLTPTKERVHAPRAGHRSDSRRLRARLAHSASRGARGHRESGHRDASWHRSQRASAPGGGGDRRGGARRARRARREDELSVDPRYRYLDDELRGRALQALMDAAAAPIDQINVTAAHSWLTLTGRSARIGYAEQLLTRRSRGGGARAPPRTPLSVAGVVRDGRQRVHPAVAVPGVEAGAALALLWLAGRLRER